MERLTFWNQLVLSGILLVGDMILEGDPNLTTSASEVWGGNSHLDPTFHYFLKLLAGENL